MNWVFIFQEIAFFIVTAMNTSNLPSEVKYGMLFVRILGVSGRNLPRNPEN
jgi:hypothetical protein